MKKQEQNPAEKAQQTAQKVGLSLMTFAALTGLVELAVDHAQLRPVAILQPAFAGASESGSNGYDNPVRREREETGPHYTSYGVAQRTPARTGRV